MAWDHVDMDDPTRDHEKGIMDSYSIFPVMVPGSRNELTGSRQIHLSTRVSTQEPPMTAGILSSEALVNR